MPKITMTIYGHKNQRKYLSGAIMGALSSHAFIFTGPDGVGKKTVARELYLLANGTKEINSYDGSLMEIIPDGTIGINDARAIQSFFLHKSSSEVKKFVIIDDAHLLSAEAANAILKTLEEPPVGAIFILISDIPGLIPQTILSRCQEVRFNLVNEEEFDKYLSGIKISKDDKEFLSKISYGRPGYAAKLTEGDSLEKAKKSVADLRRLMTQGTGDRIIYVKKMTEKDDYASAVRYWLDWVAASLKQSDKNAPILKNLLYLNNIVSQTQFNSRLAIENFLLKI